MYIEKSDLTQLVDFDVSKNRVAACVSKALQEGNENALKFFERYASWNGFFGSGVASLAGKIGRSRQLFLDPNEKFLPLADRAVYVASFIFDAARDEFNDSYTAWRDTHRCLAQSMVHAVAGYYFKGKYSSEQEMYNYLNSLMKSPLWLEAINSRVAVGYGNGSPDTLEFIFRSIGYHLGSELLADQEFSLIDKEIAKYPEFQQYLKTSTYHVDGMDHSGYNWLHIHSGGGNAVEADHFAWAVQGINHAFEYTNKDLHPMLKKWVLDGFKNFEEDHQEFFKNVMT